MKFIDDLSIAVKVNLKDEIGRQKPLFFDERFELKLTEEENFMQQIIGNLKVFASERQMLINKDKFCILIISKSRTKDFPLEIKQDDDILKVKDKIEILGVIVTSNLRWEENTNYAFKGNLCPRGAVCA